ncbi:hypothetical protein HKD37_17G048820 [Glycine soja]
MIHILQFCDIMLNPAQFQVKEEKVKVVDDSLSEADWLSEMHPLSRTSSSLSVWETLEEDKSDICTPSAQPARPTRTLSLLTLSAPKLA